MMDNQFQQMMQVNIKGRVFVICQSHGITDPSIISYYVQVIEEAAMAELSQESTAADFHTILNEQAAWLEGEIQQLGDTHTSEERAVAPSITDPDDPEMPQGPDGRSNSDKTATGYVPDAKSMMERLKDRRAELEHLLVNDCVTLKLITPKQAKKYKYELVGRDPAKAEEELVANLRNVLHEQVVKFIRKHRGGPWASATEQAEIRMQIAHTNSLQALINLSKMLLNEREEWMLKSKTSVVGRLFGGRVKMDNN
jgi:hypothetical protein